jgi:hypothetical protein
MRPVPYGPDMPLGITNYWGADDRGDENLKSVENRSVIERTNMAAIRQELTSAGVPTGIERQKRFGRFLSWLPETVRLRNAHELGIGRGLHLAGVGFVAVMFAERLRALLTAVAFARKLRRRSPPEL